jgi:hypothetical protein
MPQPEMGGPRNLKEEMNTLSFERTEKTAIDEMRQSEHSILAAKGLEKSRGKVQRTSI